MSDITFNDGLATFQSLLARCQGPDLSLFDARLHRFSAQNEQTTVADALLSLCLNSKTLAKTISKSRSPLLFTGQINLSWLFFAEFDPSEMVRIYALGPFLNENTPSFSLDSLLADMGSSLSLRAEASVLRRTLPILPYRLIQTYAAMLYALIHDEALDPSEIRLYSRSAPARSSGRNRNMNPSDLYSAEQEMLRRVREGEFDARIDASPSFEALASLHSSELSHAKAQASSYITLLSRAAIEGGLSPETGFILCERYCHDMEIAETPSALENIITLGYRDFSERVHAIQTKNMSKLIESACAYIDRMLEGELSISLLSKRSGLTEYYFSRRFKRETGLSPSEFIRRKRLQRAANLIRTTDMDIRQIAQRLQFSSLSYFSDLFHRYFGVSPRAYRKGASA